MSLPTATRSSRPHPLHSQRMGHQAKRTSSVGWPIHRVAMGGVTMIVCRIHMYPIAPYLLNKLQFAHDIEHTQQRRACRYPQPLDHRDPALCIRKEWATKSIISSTHSLFPHGSPVHPTGAHIFEVVLGAALRAFVLLFTNSGQIVLAVQTQRIISL